MEKLDILNKTVRGSNLKKSSYKLGEIESVLVVDSTLYAVIRQLEPTFDETGHSVNLLFNNHLGANESKLSPFEVLVRISNIDLEHTLTDPYTLIGKFANVLVIGENRAVSAEYVGKQETFGSIALKMSQNALYSARVLAGPDSSLLDEESVSKSFLKRNVKLTDNQLDLLDQKLSDWKSKVIRIENDSTNHNTTDQKLENELIIPSEDFFKEANNIKMKTRNCHLPVTVFTAR